MQTGMRSRRFGTSRSSSFVRDGRSTALLALLLCSVGCDGEPVSPPPPETGDIVAPAPDGVARMVRGRAPAAVNGVPSLVILTPETPTEYPVPEEPVSMDQFSMMFVPAQLLARAGQPIRFGNSDQELHNIRVVENETRDTIFNVATPAGITYEHIFERAGTYAVSCDVHTAMGAVIITTDSPYAVIADPNGAFELLEVPPGTYTASVQSGAESVDHVVVIDASDTELRLTGPSSDGADGPV